MSIGWVASATRGQALMRRRVGLERARSLAALDWPEARRALVSTMYGKELATDTGRAEARHAACEATAWQLRVLAGWLPPGQGGLARVFAAPLEIANIEGHCSTLIGEHRPGSAIRLGTLAVAWPLVSRATSTEMVRAALATSTWGDPGGTDRASLAIGLRLGWVRRLANLSPTADEWAKGGAAVLVARERFSFDRAINEPTARVTDSLLGSRWRAARSIDDLVDNIADSASWPLRGVEDPASLWQAEAAVVRRVSTDAARLAASTNRDRRAVIGIMASLLIDLHHVLTIIELAGRGPNPVEVFDAVA